MNYTKGNIMTIIDDDTEVAYDSMGCAIKAERLQKWAYRQLEAAPDMYEALKNARVWTPRDSNIRFKIDQALNKAEGK